MWNRDEVGEIEDGEGKGENTYGYHPVYLAREEEGKWHVGFLRSSSAMDFVVEEDGYTMKIVRSFFLIKTSII